MISGACACAGGLCGTLAGGPASWSVSARKASGSPQLAAPRSYCGRRQATKAGLQLLLCLSGYRAVLTECVACRGSMAHNAEAGAFVLYFEVQAGGMRRLLTLCCADGRPVCRAVDCHEC